MYNVGKYEILVDLDFAVAKAKRQTTKFNFPPNFPAIRHNHTISYRHYIPARAGARRVMAKGAFPRAEVTRGTDWDYGDDDGKLIHVCTM